MSASKRAAANICAMVDDAMTMDQVIAAEYVPLIEAAKLIEARYLSASSGIAFAKFMTERGLSELRQAVAHIEGDATP